MVTKSGIFGFDDLLYGGFIQNSAILVEGVPGAGKTTFGLEFIYKGIIEMNEPGIVITFEEFPEQLYRDASNYGWDLRKLEEQNLLRVICTSPEVILDNTMGFLQGVVSEIAAKRLLLDSVTQLNMELSNSSDLRKSVYSLCSGLKRMGLTSVLIKEVDDYNSFKTSFEEYLVDTVIRLYFEESFRSRRRFVEVLKSRGQDFISGKYPLKFADKGLEIIGTNDIPKLANMDPGDYSEKLNVGIDGLNNILGGGLLRSTTIMVEGAPGTGKSVMGLHYLLEGIKNGEKGLVVLTEESAHFINQYIHSFDICDDIEEVFLRKDILIMDQIFAKSSLEEVVSDVINIVKVNSLKRVVIDFVNTFMEFNDNLLILRTILRKLINNLNMIGCTTILILNEEQVGSNSPLKNLIQPLVQGEINLSSTIKKGKRYRSLEVSKMKGQKYISGMHLAEITSNGMSVFQRLGGI